MTSSTMFPGSPVISGGFPDAATQRMAALKPSPWVNIPTPFVTTICRCHEAVSDSRSVVDAAVDFTATAVQSVELSATYANQMNWTGNASTMFRRRLNELTGTARLVLEQAQDAARLGKSGAS